MYIPEGSLRCERVARSSAVSSRGGLRSGGRSSRPSLISFTVVLIDISYVHVKGQREPNKLKYYSHYERKQCNATHLAAVIDEDKLDGVVWVSCERRNFAGYPGQLLVGEPDLGPFAVNVFRHEDVWRS